MCVVWQVLLRWGVQMGGSVLPKSVTPSRIEDNLKVGNIQ
jgi:diketogulonate reductase-like aldo/keto reductase